MGMRIGGTGLLRSCSTVTIWRRGTGPQSVSQNPTLAASAAAASGCPPTPFELYGANQVTISI